jgi:hypothetical protein
MTKEKYNLYSIQKNNKLLDKSDIRITRIFWFALGLLLATLVITSIFLENVK